MKRLYQVNVESPFFEYMQDTTIEDLMSEDERDRLYQTILGGIVATQLEQYQLSDDEIQFIIYSNLNKKEPEVTAQILTDARLSK